ncbi:hypothetical protein BY458DRAFT_525315 [Sporodiniella umbellata]|nr:hypothetical protein BY458DRAFT_525315 [Sporodiniella umbellata]
MLESMPIYLEDGPLFRATIKEYEDQTAFLKTDLKDMITAAASSFKARQHLLETEQAFIESIRKASFTQPLFRSYLDHVLDSWREQQERLHFCLQSLVIEPLKNIYELDVKVAESKKRQFDEISKEYYLQLAKHLGNGTNKKRPLAFDRKKQHFDLARFDYYSFLTDLHGGKKTQEILYHLLHHHEKQYAFYHETCKTLERHKQGLEDVAGYIAQASREQQATHKERSERRREIESKYSISIVHPEQRVDKYRGIRDLQQNDTSFVGQKKEGFLFTCSKIIKRRHSNPFPGDHWHKYWCVVSGGQLEEYTNWKHQPQTHHPPIVLKLATVKEAQDAGRRFCFEVITPSMRRTYQATSKEEMVAWMATINNAICGSLNGTGSCVAFTDEGGGGSLKSLSGALDGLVRSRRQKTLDRRTVSPLPHLYALEAGNTFCADCGSPWPDWCSLNLGILLCIDCSGVHRSLGTHLSKVRSLTLDPESFTPERIQILQRIGNTRFNSFWEAQLPHLRPQPGDTRESKATFIRQKYVDQRFFSPPKEPAANLLLQGLVQSYPPLILYALACGADPHSPWPDALPLPSTFDCLPRYPLIFALVKDTIDHDPPCFPTAELLIQNGCEIQSPVTEWSLQRSLLPMLDYLNLKTESRGMAPIQRKPYKSASH